MCVCTPEIRTPWCGKPGCGAPRKQEEKPMKLNKCEKNIPYYYSKKAVEALHNLGITAINDEDDSQIYSIVHLFMTQALKEAEQNRAMPERAGWLPIESAPKDGTKILLRYFKGKSSDWRTIAHNDFYVTEGRFFVFKSSPDLPAPYSRSEWQDYAGRVLQTMGAKYSKNVVTHWMPLPAPPSLDDTNVADIAEIRAQTKGDTNPTDAQVEAAARAIYDVSPAHFSGTTVKVPWDEAAPPYKAAVFAEAKAALKAALAAAESK